MTSNASILKNIEEIVGRVRIDSTTEGKTKVILEFLSIEMNEEIVKEAAWNFYTAAVDNRCLSEFYAELFFGHLYNENLISHKQINNCLRYLENAEQNNFGDKTILLRILNTIITVRLSAVERDLEFPILTPSHEKTYGRVEEESEQFRLLLETIGRLNIHSIIEGDKPSKSTTKNTKGRTFEACVSTANSIDSNAIDERSKEKMSPEKGRKADSKPIGDFFRPVLAPFHIEEVTRMIERNYEMNTMSKSRREDLEVVRMKLEAVLKEKIPQKFRLDVFGSSESGFGSNKSDFDVCFRFEQEGKGDLNKRKLTLKTITRALVGTEFKNIVPTNSAKVPIVKFTVKTPSGEEIEGETVRQAMGKAVWNSRCRQRISLSSYTHIILLIHFLQQLQPPLLPVLHEMGTKKEIEVDGRDVYFYDDEPTPNWSSYNLSAGELFLRFLEYYVSFDWQNKVVQIRQQKKTRNQKGWKNKMMYIEDPFVLEHNLGGKIKSEMFSFITKSFSTAREVFFSHKERELLTSSNGGGMDNRAIGEERIDEYGAALLSRCHFLNGSAPQRKPNVASGSAFRPPAPPRNTMNIAPPLTHYRDPSNFPTVPQNTHYFGDPNAWYFGQYGVRPPYIGPNGTWYWPN